MAFQAIAEPRRRKMLLLLRNEPRSVNDIAAHFDITQQAVSQHLKVLHEAGLLEVQPQGQRRVYRVRPEGLEELRSFLREFWDDQLVLLKRAVEESDA